MCGMSGRSRSWITCWGRRTCDRKRTHCRVVFLLPLKGEVSAISKANDTITQIEADVAERLEHISNHEVALISLSAAEYADEIETT